MEKTNQKLAARSALFSWKWLMYRFCLSLAILACLTSQAQALNLISDEESEIFLQKITRPLFKAAGIPYNRNKVFIVNDDSLNAFVSDGNSLFIHTGTIISADSAEELSGVIAHETGHIMGGHIIRQKLKNESLQQASLASMLLAGTTAAVTGRGDVAMAIALGGQSSTLSNYLQYRTEQERSADESAIKLLTATHQSPQGMLRFMKRINQRNEMSGIEENPYFRTHPVTRERINFLEKANGQSAYGSSSANQQEFLRVKAKLLAFLESPERTFRRYPLSNNSIPAQYAQAIAYFKKLDITNAMNKIDALIKTEPNNPFFHELKAQMYLETGKVKQAKAEYQTALNKLPGSALLQLSLAQATLEDNPSKEELKKTISLLNQANIKQPTPMGWLLLSRAYGDLGDETYSNYAAAEYSMSIGMPKIAQKQIKSAQKSSTNNPKLKLKINDLSARIDELLKDAPNSL